jgi:ferredoxin-NADP reductase
VSTLTRRPAAQWTPEPAPTGEVVPSPEPSPEPVTRPRALFRAVGAAVRAAGALSGIGKRPPVTEVDRDLALVVRTVRTVARDVVSLRLAPPPEELRELPAWEPGAHLDLVLPSGRVRQYSLCGDPSDRFSYRIAVRRIVAGRGGSREVHELRSGAAVTARGPRAAFPLVRAPRYLFLAGGIGITPILPMVAAVAATDADWHLFYAGRNRDLMPFLDELGGFGAERLTIWSDAEHGRPPTGAELLAAAPGEASIGYLCGPPPMQAAVRGAYRDEGPVAALHVERFAPPPVVDGRPFLVELAGDGFRCAVPADRSVLDVLREHRPNLAYSCQQGFCGTCRTSVVFGEVEHRDRVLTERERTNTMTICVSRAKWDRLVLNL